MHMAAKKQTIEVDEANKNVRVYVPFHKSDDEKQMVYGYCTSEALDSHGEIVTKDAIRKAWDGYMEYANIREMHQSSAVGVTKEYTHDDGGTFIGVKVVDDRAWKFVKEGVYKGFSIGGRIVKRNKNIITELILYEISLVDRPANPEAKFSALKVDGALVDRLALEAANHTTMKKYVEFEGVKYEEDPEKPGEAKLDESGEKVLYVEEAAPAEETPAAEGDAPAETPAPEADAPAEGDAPAGDEPAEVTAAAPTADLKKVKMPTTKDSMGVITLASLLDYVNYIEELFKMNDKDASQLESVREVLKSLIATEAGEPDEKGLKTDDLAKVFGAELAKTMAPFMEKMTAVATSVDDLAKRVETIEKKKVSPRPSGSVPVEKTVTTGDGGSDKSLAEKRKAVEDIVKEIDAHASEMAGVLKTTPSRGPEMEKKSKDLYAKYSAAKRDLEAHSFGGAE